MSYIMVDIEADGPIPGDYSMICFGAIVVETSLDRTTTASTGSSSTGTSTTSSARTRSGTVPPISARSTRI
jgi:hypothetical protein